jgi:hypothetical protein
VRCLRPVIPREVSLHRSACDLHQWSLIHRVVPRNPHANSGSPGIVHPHILECLCLGADGGARLYLAPQSVSIVSLKTCSDTGWPPHTVPSEASAEVGPRGLPARRTTRAWTRRPNLRPSMSAWGETAGCKTKGSRWPFFMCWRASLGQSGLTGRGRGRVWGDLRGPDDVHTLPALHGGVLEEPHFFLGEGLHSLPHISLGAHLERLGSHILRPPCCQGCGQEGLMAEMLGTRDGEAHDPTREGSSERLMIPLGRAAVRGS